MLECLLQFVVPLLGLQLGLPCLGIRELEGYSWLVVGFLFIKAREVSYDELCISGTAKTKVKAAGVGPGPLERILTIVRSVMGQRELEFLMRAVLLDMANLTAFDAFATCAVLEIMPLLFASEALTLRAGR